MKSEYRVDGESWAHVDHACEEDNTDSPTQL